MAKTRLEILHEEEDQLTEIIRHQFIERDIATMNADFASVEQITEEIRRYMRRKECIVALIDNMLTANFEAIITITTPNGASNGTLAT